MLLVGGETDGKVVETGVKSMMVPIYSCKLVKYGKKRSLLYSENLPLMLAWHIQKTVGSPNS
jgi:hypothetical protein